MGDERPLAFVIMPFDEDFDAVWTDLIKQPLEAAGYTPERADTNLDQVNKVHQVVEKIDAASLIVADLTGNRHNVMYELGIAHTMGRPAVMITQHRHDLPFDLSGYEVFEYSTDFRAVDELRRRLEAVARAAVAGGAAFSNPVSDALSRQPAPAGSGGGGEEEEEEEEAYDVKPGRLELAAQFEQAMREIGEIFGRISDDTRSHGQRVTERTAEVEAWKAEGQPGGMSRLSELVATAAGDVMEYADKLEPQAARLEDRVGKLAQALPTILEWEAGPGEDPEQVLEALEGLRDAMETSLATTRTAKGATQKFRNSFAEVRGLHSQMDYATAKADRRLANIMSFMDRYESLFSTAGKRLGERIRELRDREAGS